jgi:hypothetical protein
MISYVLAMISLAISVCTISYDMKYDIINDIMYDILYASMIIMISYSVGGHTISYDYRVIVHFILSISYTISYMI